VNESPPRAMALSFPSDEMIVRRGPDGSRRYFRAEGDLGEEYSYQRPFILELEITRRCNLKCVHCYAEATDQAPPDELGLAEIEAVLDDGRLVGIPELSLTGGEVMIRPDFLKIIDAGLKRGYHVRFVSNATLLTENLLQELCRRPIKMITVSLDATDPAVHDRIRGPGSHGAAIRGLDRLAEAGFKVSVITAFSKINLGQFESLLKYCAGRGFDWQVQMTSAKGRCKPGITLTPDEYYTLGEKVAAAFTTDLPINLIPMDDLATFSQLYPLSALATTWQGQCTGGLLNLMVRADGAVTPCSALAFDECVVGNIRTESLETICREERCRDKLAWLSPEALTGACATCAFKEDCRGGCPEILLTMCRRRTENEYCFHRLEQDGLIREFTGHD
jgi:radical SAM protein with 4Fe4S-binding SPASM domain